MDTYECCDKSLLFNLFKLATFGKVIACGLSRNLGELCIGTGYPVVTVVLLLGNMFGNVPNLVRIEPIYIIEVTGDF